MGVPCGAPWCSTSLAGHPWGVPMRSLLAPQSLLEAFLENFKMGFSTKIPKSTFTIHDDIFQRPVELKIFMWA